MKVCFVRSCCRCRWWPRCRLRRRRCPRPTSSLRANVRRPRTRSDGRWSACCRRCRSINRLRASPCRCAPAWSASRVRPHRRSSTGSVSSPTRSACASASPDAIRTCWCWSSPIRGPRCAGSPVAGRGSSRRSRWRTSDGSSRSRAPPAPGSKPRSAAATARRSTLVQADRRNWRSRAPAASRSRSAAISSRPISSSTRPVSRDAIRRRSPTMPR